MKIDSSTIGMDSVRTVRTMRSSAVRFQIKDYRNDTTQDQHLFSDPEAMTSDGREKQEQKQQFMQKEDWLENWQSRFEIRHVRMSARSVSSATNENLRQLTLSYILDMLFAGRNGRYADRQRGQTVNLTEASAMQPVQQGAFWLSAFEEGYTTEQESVAFSSTGTVKTQDGREISFQVNLGMSREVSSYFQNELKAGAFQFCDPLVINLSTDTAAFADQTFYFDIDGDGQEDEISRLSEQSGYLALDKNGDGVINDGNELFGTKSGDGFRDLTQYDRDHNGWIDENDEIWDKLKIWCMDENGNSRLYTLKEKGVGAICLQSAATDYTLMADAKTAQKSGQSIQRDIDSHNGGNHEVQGAIRRTGIFLYENAIVGTIQHVDLAKYYKEA